MRRFGFQLEDDLHEQLKLEAEAEGISMAAVCRNALQEHLARAKRSEESNVSTWDRLMSQVSDFLSSTKFLPESTPEAISPSSLELYDSPQRARSRHRPAYVAPRRYNKGLYRSDTRWLDEIWA